jgi:hypothetical protein
MHGERKRVINHQSLDGQQQPGSKCDHAATLAIHAMEKEKVGRDRVLSGFVPASWSGLVMMAGA